MDAIKNLDPLKRALLDKDTKFWIIIHEIFYQMTVTCKQTEKNIFDILIFAVVKFAVVVNISVITISKNE